MKISIFSANIYPLLQNFNYGFGGSEIELYQIANELVKDHKFQVSVLGIVQNDFEFTQSNFNFVPIKKQNGPRARGNFIRYVIYVFRLFFSEKSDVYFAALASLETIIMFAAAKVRRKKFIFRIEHDWEVSREGLKKIFGNNRIMTLLSILLLKRANHVIAQTNYQQSCLSNNFGVQSKVIRNSHYIPKLENMASREYSIWVGRIIRDKRPDLFLELAENNPNGKFLLVGMKSKDQGFYDEIKTKAQSIPNLEWHEGVAWNEIQSYYEKGKLFILTSKEEGLPNTIVEAMIHGLPTISLFLDPDGTVTESGGSCAKGDWPAFQKIYLDYSQESKDKSELVYNFAKQNFDISKNILEYIQIICQTTR